MTSATAGETFRFRSPNKMVDHRTSENGIHSSNGQIQYKELHTAVTEAVTCFTHICAYGTYDP